MKRILILIGSLLLTFSALAASLTTFHGELACVPRRGVGGVQPANCMLGFKMDGKYYELHGLDVLDISRIPMNQPLIVKGRLDSKAARQSGNYDTVGVIVADSWSLASSGRSDIPSDKPLSVYEIKEIQLLDEPGKPIIYVIGFRAFRSVQALKADVAQIPAGSTLTFDRGSCLPPPGDPLSTPEGMADFKKFVESKKITFEVVPRP